MTEFYALTALTALLLSGTAVQAATYNFGGTTDSGPLAGTSFSGQMSFADAGLPSDGEVLLNSFSMRFAGQSYSLDSATTAPSAAFSSGQFVGLSYQDTSAVNTALRPHVSFTPGFLGLADAYFSYVGSNDLGGFGSYSISAVPEPASYLLMLAGSCAFALRSRRR